MPRGPMSEETKEKIRQSHMKKKILRENKPSEGGEADQGAGIASVDKVDAVAESMPNPERVAAVYDQEPVGLATIPAKVVDDMNDLARRIFEGQSPDLHPRVRVERIVLRLREKGYNLEGLKIPIEGFERWLG